MAVRPGWGNATRWGGVGWVHGARRRRKRSRQERTAETSSFRRGSVPSCHRPGDLPVVGLVGSARRRNPVRGRSVGPADANGDHRASDLSTFYGDNTNSGPGTRRSEMCPIDGGSVDPPPVYAGARLVHLTSVHVFVYDRSPLVRKPVSYRANGRDADVTIELRLALVTSHLSRRSSGRGRFRMEVDARAFVRRNLRRAGSPCYIDLRAISVVGYSVHTKRSSQCCTRLSKNLHARETMHLRLFIQASLQTSE